jgi:transgelin
MLNKIRAGSAGKVNTRSMPFMMMENIQKFLGGCRKLGVPDSDLFAVVDL